VGGVLGDVVPVEGEIGRVLSVQVPWCWGGAVWGFLV